MTTPGWTAPVTASDPLCPEQDGPAAAEDAAGAADCEAAFDRCAHSLFRYFAVRTGGDRHLADDLMQQLWIHTRGCAGRVPAHELEPYLRGIARNLVRLHWRRTSRRPPAVSLAQPELAAELSRQMATTVMPPEALSNREVRQQLLLALTELSAEEQRLLIGHYFDGRSYAELAADAGAASPRVIEGRLYRARQALRRKLEHLER